MYSRLAGKRNDRLIRGHKDGIVDTTLRELLTQFEFTSIGVKYRRGGLDGEEVGERGLAGMCDRNKRLGVLGGLHDQLLVNRCRGQAGQHEKRKKM